jgi:hypothetical protein
MTKAAPRDAKEVLMAAFNDIGGIKALVAWARTHRATFYTQLFTKLLPLEMNTQHDVNVKVTDSREATIAHLMDKFDRKLRAREDNASDGHLLRRTRRDHPRSRAHSSRTRDRRAETEERRHRTRPSHHRRDAKYKYVASDAFERRTIKSKSAAGDRFACNRQRRLHQARRTAAHSSRAPRTFLPAKRPSTNTST